MEQTKLELKDLKKMAKMKNANIERLLTQAFAMGRRYGFVKGKAFGEEKKQKELLREMLTLLGGTKK
jgi:hypothetical protein